MAKPFDGAAISKADRDFLDSLDEHPLKRQPLYGVPCPTPPVFAVPDPKDPAQIAAQEAYFAAVVDWLLVNYAYCKHAFGGKGGIVSLIDCEFVTVTSLAVDMEPATLEWEGPRGGQKTCSAVGTWRKHRQRQRVDRVEMRPDRPRPAFEEDGAIIVNSYRPPVHPRTGGEIETFLVLLEHLIPDETERTWTWHWLCHKVRRPWVPMVAIIFVAEAYGSGRGTLCDILELVFGKDYVWPCTFGDLAGTSASARWNAQLAKSLLVVVNEATEEEGPPQAQRRRVYETLKGVVDPSPTARRRYEKKFQDPTAQTSSASEFVNTNHPDAIKLPKGDRRFSVVTCGPPMTIEMRETVRAWMADPANIGALYRALLEAPAAPAEVFDPYGVPPPFAGRLEMMRLGKTDVEDAYEAAMAALKGCPLFTRTQAVRLIGYFVGDHLNAGSGQDRAKYTITKRAKRLRDRGEPYDRFWYRNKQDVLYASTASERQRWLVADRELVVAALDRTEERIARVISAGSAELGAALKMAHKPPSEEED